VLSPHNEATDRSKKLPIYARHEVSHVWLAQPFQRPRQPIPRIHTPVATPSGRWAACSTLTAMPTCVGLLARDRIRVRQSPPSNRALPLGRETPRRGQRDAWGHCVARYPSSDAERLTARTAGRGGDNASGGPLLVSENPRVEPLAVLHVQRGNLDSVSILLAAIMTQNPFAWRPLSVREATWVVARLNAGQRQRWLREELPG
jgi:hypothetical protein